MRTLQGLIILPKQAIVVGLTIWLVVELCAFALVVNYLGVSGALLLGLLTSVIGFSLLRSVGRDAAGQLRHVINGRSFRPQPDSVIDGTIAAIGGALMILPGFVSDFVGLALSAPSVRVWLASKIKGSQAFRSKTAGRDSVIDLGAQDWQRIDETEPRLGGHR